jgi:hypothetical protein
MYKRICILFAMLLFLLPTQARADLVFCAPFDTNFDAKNPDNCNVAAALSGSSPFFLFPTIDNDVYKFGGGSSKHADKTSGIIYSNLSEMPGNEGAMGVWVREPAYNIYAGDDVSGLENSLVRISRSEAFLGLSMRDSTGAIIINWAGAIASVEGWHYLEVNWKWSDADGYTILTRDGVVEMTSTAGNDKGRDVTTEAQLLVTDVIDIDDRWVDEFLFWDEVQHTGSFTPPEAALCDCGPNIVLNFGRPGGWGFGYGFGN